MEMAREVADWLVRRDLLARTVTIKVRYDDFTTITRSHSAAATRDADDIVRRALALLDKTEAGQRPVRLLGAGVHNLIGLVDLDDEAERWPLFQNADKLSE
jgi:DNA polymerase-4